MSKYKIEIEEVLQRVEEIDADNLEEALDIIDEKYKNQEIILDYEDFKEYEIREYNEGVKQEEYKKLHKINRLDDEELDENEYEEI